LLKKISKEPSYWVLVAFLLVFTHSLAKGFYNFSLATAFYLWMVLWWMKFMETRSNRNAIIFFCFTSLIFFTQLLPFVFGIITCFALTVSYALAGANKVPQRPLLFFFKNTITLAIFVAPFLFLMFWFVAKEHGLGLSLQHHFYRFTELARLKYFVTVSGREEYFTSVAGIVLVALFFVGLFIRFKSRVATHQYDGFFYALAVASVVYFFFPENFMGRVILISMRAQLFMFILLAACIAYMVPLAVKNAGGGVLFLCFIGLFAVRLPVQMEASDGCADYNSVAQYIKPNSVVLPLDFAPEGRDASGKAIANRNYLFSHAASYMGAVKPLILLDNYEALAGYFPLIWQYATNPYQHLSRWEGLEAQPPGADIDAYENATDVNIDYVVLWCYDSSYANKGHYAQLALQINKGYHHAYTSPTGRTILYERNRQ
jgi:hypothetical protein